MAKIKFLQNTTGVFILCTTTQCMCILHNIYASNPVLW